MTQTTLRGSCLCGAVKHEASGESKRFVHRHCSRCRKATGTGHASNLVLQPGALRWLSGEEQRIHAFKVPDAKRFTNVFCTTCGGRLPRQVMDAVISRHSAATLRGAERRCTYPRSDSGQGFRAGRKIRLRCAGPGIGRPHRYIASGLLSPNGVSFPFVAVGWLARLASGGVRCRCRGGGRLR